VVAAGGVDPKGAEQATVGRHGGCLLAEQGQGEIVEFTGVQVHAERLEQAVGVGALAIGLEKGVFHGGECAYGNLYFRPPAR
jgi:hypothetical protein